MEKSECNFAKEHGTIEPFTLACIPAILGLYYKFDMILDAAEQLTR